MLSTPSYACTLLLIFGILSFVSSYNPSHTNSRPSFRKLLMDPSAQRVTFAAPAGTGSHSFAPAGAADAAAMPPPVSPLSPAQVLSIQRNPAPGTDAADAAHVDITVFRALKYSSAKYTLGVLPDMFLDLWEPRVFVFEPASGILHWGCEDTFVSNAMHKYLGSLVLQRGRTTVTSSTRVEGGIDITNAVDLKGKGFKPRNMQLRNVEIVYGTGGVPLLVMAPAEHLIWLMTRQLLEVPFSVVQNLQLVETRQQDFQRCLRVAVDADLAHHQLTKLTFVADIEINPTGHKLIKGKADCEFNAGSYPKLTIIGKRGSLFIDIHFAQGVVVEPEAKEISNCIQLTYNSIGGHGKPLSLNNIRDTDVLSCDLLELMREAARKASSRLQEHQQMSVPNAFPSDAVQAWDAPQDPAGSRATARKDFLLGPTYHPTDPKLLHWDRTKGSDARGV